MTSLFFRAILGIIKCQKLMFRKGEGKLAIYGYSRVSTSNQDYKTQIRKLEEAGAEKIFSEKYTGTKKEGRKELEELLSIVKAGDKVLVTKIDRLARSVTFLFKWQNKLLLNGKYFLKKLLLLLIKQRIVEVLFI